MAKRPTPTTWTWQAERGARARTYRLLMSEAMTLVRRGRIPSVAEVALNAGVSRATAYRYFPSRSTLITAVLEEEPFRRGHRRYLLHRAAAPLKAKLGARAYERLLKALSLVYGIEPYVVLKDMWGAKDREVEALSRWVLDAFVETALRQAAAAPRRRGKS